MASISIQTLRIGRMCLDNFVHVRSCTRVTPRWHLPHWGHLQRGASAAVSGEADSPQARPDEAKLQSEVDKLSKEIADLLEKDKYKRALADGENMRVRLTKQIEDAKLFGIQGFCKDLLEVADTLGKATESVPQEEVNDSNPHLKNLYEGLSMTEAQLQQVRVVAGVQAAWALSSQPSEREVQPQPARGTVLTGGGRQGTGHGGGGLQGRLQAARARHSAGAGGRLQVTSTLPCCDRRPVVLSTDLCICYVIMSGFVMSLS
ncbi:grpE protein homolog 2, mitochondrial isoform X1 [Bacillus rossius redtenbacheri]|uniref:grpE protein homolog 2, mitochondrial isoform X1 n=1 Tax=Bacillus rossius redtenbacheri TaxID=93214 RepID=UPI002FDD3E41